VWFDDGPVMCVWQFAPELKMQPWYAVRLVAASPVHIGDASACGATPGVCRIEPAANSANRIRLIIVYLPGNHRFGLLDVLGAVGGFC
jgi:hypothetical protein